MAVTLKQVGDMAQDLYYQDYKADEQFFDLPHFKFLLATKYAEILNAEVKINKAENKVLTGFSFLEVSPDWLIWETVKVKRIVGGKPQAELPTSIFSFDYDVVGSGVQFVNMGDSACGELVRISMNDVYALCRMPVTSQIFWWVKGSNKILFENVGACNIDEVEVGYIPAVDCNNDESVMSEDKVHAMITEVLNLMFGSKNGNIVDKTNDSNPNTSPATEINTSSIQQ